VPAMTDVAASAPVWLKVIDIVPANTASLETPSNNRSNDI